MNAGSLTPPNKEPPRLQLGRLKCSDFLASNEKRDPGRKQSESLPSICAF